MHSYIYFGERWYFNVSYTGVYGEVADHRRPRPLYSTGISIGVVVMTTMAYGEGKQSGQSGVRWTDTHLGSVCVFSPGFLLSAGRRRRKPTSR